ncbi:MAG: hypothetical protein Kow00124_24690 [Anaerolineae bacterium]
MSVSTHRSAPREEPARANVDDGLWDILLGLVLAALAVNAGLNARGVASEIRTLIFVGMEALVSAAFVLGRRLISQPRAAGADVGQRRGMSAALLVIISAMTAGTIIAGVALLVGRWRFDSDLTALSFPVIWPAACMTFFCAAAIFLGLRRLVLLGALFAVTVPLDYVLSGITGRDLGVLAFGIPALIALTVGGLVLRRFLRTHPRV